jgi:hypothetical protein
LENYNCIRPKIAIQFTGTIEGILVKNINETAYSNVNFENPVGTLNGPDRRPLYNVSDMDYASITM